ncbi:MAG: D-glycero-beta-D-manno-heptose-1,7-bisphosphate 7-phosphatase [Gammaproteobacteria bacterium]|nr:MAG: D-glycero-beta-D-manno-heptose-1,7-bisphosphate 7-phosphatase [Gammaproteobacteria bacterium]RLA35661.1 MAG: D-glycero-beta-D-manno-heptose-1,7-bisphosphate 7-phosphatase [Gammaproteobacteria bacterium]
MSGRLVILDRDGVINHDSDEFVKSPSEWEPIDGSIEAIAELSNAGFTVAVATNQSGVGRKLIDMPTLEAIHKKMRQAVTDAGGDLGRIVFCPHHPDDNCDCRKPKPGLLNKLARQYGVPINGVPMVGDSERDIAAAKAVSGRPILVLTGNGQNTAAVLAEKNEEVETYPDLQAAAKQMIANSRGSGSKT